MKRLTQATIGDVVTIPPRKDGIRAAHEGEEWQVLWISEAVSDVVTLALVSDPSVHCGASYSRMNLVRKARS